MFINYRRIASDENTVAELSDKLMTRTLPNTNPPRRPIVFIDQQCLPYGFDWKDGFLKGIQHSKVIVLLISREALVGIRSADSRADNVLLEYEYALKMTREGRRVTIYPLLLENLDQSPFNDFNVDVYPAKRHASPDSIATGTIRDTMRELFTLNGAHSPRTGFALMHKVNTIISLIGN